MKWYAVPFALFVLVACQSSSQPENKTPATDSNSLKTLIPADSDTLYITTPSALYYRPDSLRLEQWKKRIGEEDFETVADDWSYYMMTSQDFLDSMRMPVVEAGDKKIVKFVQTAGHATIIRLDTLQNLWGVYFFTPDKTPLYANIVSVQDEYHQYFHK